MNLVSVIAERGLLLVFVHVLLQQLGVPIADSTAIRSCGWFADGPCPLTRASGPPSRP